MTKELEIWRTGGLAKTRALQAEELARCDYPGCSAVASRDVYWGDRLEPGLMVEEVKRSLKAGRDLEGYDLNFSSACEEHFRSLVAKISHQKRCIYLGWSKTSVSLRR